MTQQKTPTSPGRSGGQVPGSQSSRVAFWLCLVSVVVSLAMRVLYLAQPWRIDLAVPPAFLAAEGLVGIMGRHILQGARPVFYYGQYYLGAFEAYVAAGVFDVLGDSITTLRLVPVAFAFAWIVLAGLIAAELYGRRAGYLAAALVALPSQFTFEWGFIAWGGHANVAMILLGVYVFVLALKRFGQIRLAALAFVSGFSIWVNQLALGYVAVYALALAAWLRPRRKQVAVLAVAGLVGMSPLLYGNVVEPLGTVRNLASRVRSSWRLSARLSQESDPADRFYQSVPLFQVLGAQPRRDGKWSTGGVLAAFFLIAGGLAGAARAHRMREQDPLAFRGSMLVLACAGMSVLAGLSGFSGQPVGRYNLPIYPLLCVLAAGWVVTIPRVAVPLVGLVVLANAIRIATPTPGDERTPNRVVFEALLDRDLHHGYGADNMYDLVFESGERVIIEPVEWTRYAPYRAAVDASDRIFYLYREGQERKVSYEVFTKYLADAAIQYRRLDLGEFHVLYDLEPADKLSARAIAELRHEIRDRKRKSPEHEAMG